MFPAGLMSTNPLVISSLIAGAVVAILMAIRGGRGGRGRRA